MKSEYNLTFIFQLVVLTLLNCLLVIVAAISETKRFMEDIEYMKNAKGQICSLILEKQRKIASLESDSSTLIQVASFCACGLPYSY